MTNNPEVSPATLDRRCGECRHMQQMYWDNGFSQEHHCAKSNERRRDSFRSSGDHSQDFMNEFRKFYDATAKHKSCAYFEERPLLDGPKMETLVVISMEPNKSKGFPFFSDGNRVCESMAEKFVKRDQYSDERHGEVRGWKLTDLGKFEVARQKEAVHEPK